MSFLRELAGKGIRISLNGDALACSAPEGVLSEEIRAEIARRKPEIVSFLRLGQSPVELHLRRVPPHAPRPLSFAQQRLWFLHQLNPDDPAYNLGLHLPLPVAPDPAVLERALGLLARRHDILRTAFPNLDGVPVQEVTKILPTVRVEIVPDGDEAAMAAAAAQIEREEVQRPFRLEAAPPVRALLIRTGTSARFLMVLHHIIADGWSLGIVVRELRALYVAEHFGREVPLAPLEWQYADYAYAVRRQFEESDQSHHESYWRTKLAPPLAPLDLPTDFTRPPELGSRGAVHVFPVPATVAQGLRALGRSNNATLSSALLAGFNILLHRYSGQGAIVIGTPVANRTRVELESMIGMFVSTMMLRVNLADDPGVRTVIRRVHADMLETQEHAEYPFEKIVEQVRTDRDLARSPLFQASFVFHNTPGSGGYDIISAGAIFELSLIVTDGEGDLSACFEYNRDLFEPATLQRMAAHFLRIVTAMVEGPERRVSELPLLTESERHRVLHEWNHTTFDDPMLDQSVHQVVEAQAAHTPDAPALQMGDTALTYRELNAAANRFAHHLIALGAGPETRVGLCLDRSTELVVALLGILKAGAAFVSLDPDNPVARLRFMIEDAGLGVLVLPGLEAGEFADLGCRVVTLEGDRELIAAQPDTSPMVSSNRSHAAYMLYTSGSTGKPKGVVVEHYGLTNFIAWMRSSFPLKPEDRILHTTSFSFDVSIRSLFWPLVSGATVVIAPSEDLRDPAALAALVLRNKITQTRFVPSMLGFFIDAPAFGSCTTLRRVFCGGGALPSALETRFFARCREFELGTALVNTYGPTETTINVTTWTCDNRDRGAIVPIGRPIGNTRVYVLDERLQPVPIGVAGELYVGGVPVSRGYHGAPELTSQRFIQDPFAPSGGGRLYRTGDRVRWRSEGILEFLGRLDDQLKIRGFRIEPGEVEATLLANPDVGAAAVVAREDQPGNRRLVAYVVPANERSVSAHGLRDMMRQRLPEHMIPTSIVWLDSIPLTANGKVDRTALPAPDGLSAGTGLFVPPAEGLESTVATIWSELLGVKRVSAEDNFFDLGGHSLLLLQLQRRLATATGATVSVVDLFRHQTVRGIAEHLAEVQAGSSAESPVVRSSRAPARVAAIQPHGLRPPLFVIPGLSGEILSYGPLARALGSNQPLYGLRSVGLDAEAEPLDRIEEIAANFAREIRRVQPRGPYFLAGVCIGGVVAYELAQQLLQSSETTSLLVMIETWPPTTRLRNRYRSTFVQRVQFLRDGIGRYYREIRSRPFRESLGYLRKKAGVLTEIIGTGDVYRGDKDALYRDLVILRNRFAAAHYVPRPYPGSLRLVLNRPLIDGERDPRLTWRALAAGPSEVVRIPAKDSGQVHQVPHVYRLAEVLRGWIEEALPESP